MIYFVVAQKNEDGKWKVFGPWDYINGADDKIAELSHKDADSTYCQVELARVLTDEDDPDKNEWIRHDK